MKVIEFTQIIKKITDPDLYDDDKMAELMDAHSEKIDNKTPDEFLDIAAGIILLERKLRKMFNKPNNPGETQ